MNVRRPSTLTHLCVVMVALVGTLPAQADVGKEMPRDVTLVEAVQAARTRGYDVLLAAASARTAESDVRIAGQTPNPVLNIGIGRTLDCAGGACANTAWGGTATLSDQGLIEGAISRKRALKESVMRRALDAARFHRADAERIIIAATKTQYVETCAAERRLDFAREVATSLERSVSVQRVRYPRVIDEGALARVELESMKALQEVDRSVRDFRQQQIELAALMGMTGLVPEIAVDREVLKFRVPDAIATTDRETLLRSALVDRADRRGTLAQEAGGDQALALARRQRVPDVSLWLQYQQQGAGANSPQPSTLMAGLALPLPFLYRQEGEIAHAESEREGAAIQRRKLEASIAAEIDSAWTTYQTARSIVERYEGLMLERAKVARTITQAQFEGGVGTFTDLFDAQRGFVQVNGDYYAELVKYWTAVFALERAVGREIVK